MSIDIRPPLVALLKSDPGIQALIPDPVFGCRIYPAQGNQGDVGTWLVYQQISRVTLRTFKGPTGLADVRIQLSCWGENAAAYIQAMTLAAAVKAAVGSGATARPADATAGSITKALDGFTGQWYDPIGAAWFRIGRAWVIDEGDLYEAPASGERKGPSGVRLDLMIFYEEGR